MPPRNRASTPARVTRARSKTPLPPLSTKSSHAYGAPGRADLRTQVATSSTNIHDVFSRRVATAESIAEADETPNDEDEDEDEDEEEVTANGTNHQNSYHEDDEDEEESEEEPEEERGEEPELRPPPDETTANGFEHTLDVRDPTRLSVEATYVPRDEKPARLAPRAATRSMPRASVQPHMQQPTPARQRNSARQLTPARTSPEAHEPSPIQIFIRTLPRYVPQAFREGSQSLVRSTRQFFNNVGPSTLSTAHWSLAILVAGILFFISASIGNGLIYSAAELFPWRPEFLQPWREGFVYRMRGMSGISPYDQPPSWIEQKWYEFKHDKIWSERLPGYNMPELQWAININLYQRVENVEQKIGSMLGEAPLHQQTKGLLEDMLPKLMVLKEKDGEWVIPDELWQALAARLADETPENEKIWDAFVERNRMKLDALEGESSSGTNNPELDGQNIVSREILIAELDRNYVMIQKQFATKLDDVERKMLKQAKQVAERTSTDLIDRSGANRHAKMQAGTLAYTNIIVNSGNALKEPNYFSPGLGARVNPKLTSPTAKRPRGPLQWIYRTLIGAPSPNPPIAALQGWDEATDCWCAAPQDNGHAQIAIEMGFKIYPERFVVEHIPHTGTVNIAAAPQDVEIWVETSSERHAKRVQQAIAETVPEAYWETCVNGPSDKHVCIGKGRYDIHGDNYVQMFPTFVDTEGLGLAVNKVVARVTTNWGAKWTCLYRIRMVGNRNVKK